MNRNIYAVKKYYRAEVEDGGVTSEKGKKFKERGDTILKNIAGNLHNKVLKIFF
jgi:hypothetical protein